MGTDLVAPFEFGDTPYCVSGSANTVDLYPLIRPGTITAPIIRNPADLFILSNTTGNSVVWEASSLIPSMYQIVVNGSVLVSREWDGAAIIYSVDDLSPGWKHNVTCIVYDIAGRSVNDTVVVTVLSDSPETPSPFPEDLQSILIGVVLGIGLIGVLFILFRLVRRD